MTSKGWGIVSAVAVLPIAAILHHALFFPPSCMLNPFGKRYTAHTLWLLLTQDPSIALGILGGVLLFFVGRRFPVVKPMAFWGVLSFLPLTIWLWDIPLLGRPICRHFHDDRLTLFGVALRSRYFYALGCLLWLITLAIRRPWRNPKASTD